MTESQKQRIYNEMEARHTKLTNQLQPLINGLLTRIVSSIKATSNDNLIQMAKTKSAEFNVDFWLDYIKKRFTLKLSPLLMQEALFNANIAFEGFDLEASEIDLNGVAFSTSISRAVNSSVSNIVESLYTIDSEIKDVIAEIINENQAASTAEIAELIKEDVNKLSKKIKNRATTIARTTATKMQSEAKNSVFDAMSKKVKVKKVWLSDRSSTTRKAHKEADGQVANEFGFFRVGGENLKGPGLGTKPENNINCKCQIIYQKA